MRQLTFEEETPKGEGGDRKSGVVPQEAQPTKGPTLAKLTVSSSSKTGLGSWLAERRALQERMERVEAYLGTPEGQRWVSEVAAELRACPECHVGAKDQEKRKYRNAFIEVRS